MVFFLMIFIILYLGLVEAGGTHIFGRTGMCRPNGWLFYKKSLNMGPGFYPKKSLNMGQLFWLSPKICDFRGFRHAKTLKIVEFWKNRPIFEGKSVKWVPFLAKITLKDGYGFWGSSGTLLSNSNLSTPPPRWKREKRHTYMVHLTHYLNYQTHLCYVTYMTLKSEKKK